MWFQINIHTRELNKQYQVPCLAWRAPNTGWNAQQCGYIEVKNPQRRKRIERVKSIWEKSNWSRDEYQRIALGGLTKGLL